MIKRFYYPVLLFIPVLFTVLAVNGYGFFYRAMVSFSCAVILFLFPDPGINKSIRYVIASFLVSIGGDWFMSHIGDIPVRFIYGIGLFFVAHIGFLLFGLKNGRLNGWLLLIILAAAFAFFFSMLASGISHTVLYIAVVMYLVISCSSLAAAIGVGISPVTRWFFSLGIGALVFSDSMIGLDVFAGNHSLKFLILPVYFSSHILMTFSLMRKN